MKKVILAIFLVLLFSQVSGYKIQNLSIQGGGGPVSSEGFTGQIVIGESVVGVMSSENYTVSLGWIYTIFNELSVVNIKPDVNGTKNYTLNWEFEWGINGDNPPELCDMNLYDDGEFVKEKSCTIEGNICKCLAFYEPAIGSRIEARVYVQDIAGNFVTGSSNYYVFTESEQSGPGEEEEEPEKEVPPPMMVGFFQLYSGFFLNIGIICILAVLTLGVIWYIDKKKKEEEKGEEEKAEPEQKEEPQEPEPEEEKEEEEKKPESEKKEKETFVETIKRNLKLIGVFISTLKAGGGAKTKEEAREVLREIKIFKNRIEARIRRQKVKTKRGKN